MRGGIQLTGTATDGLAPLLLAAAIGLALAGMGPALAQGLEIVERKLPADAQPQADDVLILRDGRTERGRLMGCAADSCTLGGSSVPRESIAWIGLEADDASPPGARDASADAVHLRNGSVRPGRLVGISQYEVATERGGHPRDEVAWIALEGDTPEQEVNARPPPQEGPAGPQDALVLRNDDLREGELDGCGSNRCTFDDASIPRTAIAWIGLQVEHPMPPGVQDPSVDEIHLRDGSVHGGRVLEISEDEVMAEGRRHPRDAVAWVHLAADRQAISPAPPGSVEHLYDAVIEVNVVEKLDYRDSAADIYPPCEIGTAERRVRWTARLPARYSRVDAAEIMKAADEQAQAAGVPQQSVQVPEGMKAVTEVLFSEQSGETRFDLFEERVDQKWFVWAEGMCTFIGSYRPHTCKRSLTGKPLSIQLGWSPETAIFLASNEGPDIEAELELGGAESQGTTGTVCSASYLNVAEFQPESAQTKFGGSKALFDGVSIEPSAQDLERLRAGEEVVLRGGVRFKDLSECCVGQTFARIGAEFDVHATAEIRLIPRR